MSSVAARKCAVAAVCVFFTHAALAQRSMPTEEIVSAIALGQEGNPKPYQATYSGAYTAGVVYTPFIRIAVAARLARQAGRHFGIDDVQPWMASPEVWVALRWFPRDAPGYSADLVAQATAEHQHPVVQMVPKGFGPKDVDAVDPLWTKGPDALAALGPPPFDDIVAVAAFPREALEPGRDIIVYYTVSSSTGRKYPGRAIRLETDVSAWK